MLYMIGIGLSDANDITVKGLETVKKCTSVYLEGYTSKLQCSVEELEGFYGKEVIVADREMVEKKAEETILKDAADGDAAFLVIGDVFGATTHVDLMMRAKKAGIKVGVVHNVSILNAVGITGLELYKFGKVTSIPFDNANVDTPVTVYNMNKRDGLHTLFLLDLDPINGKFMTIQGALQYLIPKIPVDVLCVGCAALGSDAPEIKVGKMSEISKASFTKFPQCLIIPGELHFMEEEALGMYK
jgi:diphthine synthase